MEFYKQALLAASLTLGTAAHAACVQEAMRVGENLGGAFCDETKKAYANTLVVFPRLAYHQLTCPDGSPFDYIDVMSCKRAMANEVSYDRFCRRIFRQNDQLDYAGTFMTPRSRYTNYQSRCNS